MKFIMVKTNYSIKKLTWEDVKRLTGKMAEDIINENTQIDLIVTILRGGMPIALLLSSMLKVEDMSCVHIKRSINDEPNTEFKKPINKGITNANMISGKNILIIDDVLDSLETLNYVIEIIKPYNPKSIKTAGLINFNKETFDKKEIYSGVKMQEYKWIVFPWEDTADITDNVNK